MVKKQQVVAKMGARRARARAAVATVATADRQRTYTSTARFNKAEWAAVLAGAAGRFLDPAVFLRVAALEAAARGQGAQLELPAPPPAVPVAKRASPRRKARP